MTNTKAENAVAIMRIGERFIADSVVQLNLISNNPEDVYDILENDFDVVTTTNLRTGREIAFEVGWSEIESLTLVSNPSEEEMYIDLINGNEYEAVKLPFPIPSESKVLFTFEDYTVAESEVDGRIAYYLSNTKTDKTYEILLETCFSLMTRYLNEDEHYILLNVLTSLEDRAVSR